MATNKFINRQKLLASFLRKQAETSGLPVEIGIELTNHCNLACIMCPRNEMVAKKIRPLGRMDGKLFKKIINEVNDFAEIVYLHGLGESFLNPKIFEFISYAKEKNVPVGLSTNVTFLNQKNAKKLLDSGIDYLILAVDGATKKTYEKIRVNADFKKVEKNIENFLKQRKKTKSPPFTVIQFVTMLENEKEVESFKKKWQGKGATVRIKPKIALKASDKRKDIKRKPYCFHIFRQLNITWDGEVMACCEDVFASFSLGNVNKNTLKQVWNSSRMKRLRRINFAGEHGKIDICKNCNYPQPTMLEAAGVLIFDHLTVKKALPFLEKYFG